MKMRNEKDANSCLFGEELVAYIYGELSLTNRDAFENHLLNCSGCTAEFAGISMSRLEVFEWHRDDFLPLATPQFVIPFERKPASEPRYSWLEALRGLVWSPMRVTLAGGSLAALAAAFGLFFIANSNPDTDVAAGSVEVISPAANPIQAAPEVLEPAAPDPVKIGTTRPLKREFSAADSKSNVRATRAKSVVPRKETKPVVTSAQNLPRLGTFAEPEDMSLRLADLMANIDTKDF
jgi:anti-sigma factor RsiW